MYSTITGTIKNPKGQPLKNILIRFTLADSGYQDSSIYLKSTAAEAFTDSEGRFSVNVWVNSESAVDSRYLIEVINSGEIIDTLYAYVPAKPAADFEELITLSGLAGVSVAVRYSSIAEALGAVDEVMDNVNKKISEINTAINNIDVVKVNQALSDSANANYGVNAINKVLYIFRSALAAGTADVPNLVSRIWDEYTSLKIRYINAGEVANNVTTYALSGGRIAEREFTGPIYLSWAGALGDGVTNDSLALKRAIDAAPVGGVIDGEGKTYLLGYVPDWKLAAITRGNFTLRNLKGVADTVNGGADLCSMITVDGNPLPTTPKTIMDFESRRLKNITFEDIHLDGRRASMYNVGTQHGTEDSGRHCFRVIGRVSNITFRRCTGINAPVDGLCMFSSHAASPNLGTASNGNDICFISTVIEDCVFEGNGRCGASFDSMNGVRIVGKSKFNKNGLNTPDYTNQPKTSGKRGRTIPVNGVDTLFAQGIDFESYGTGGSCSNVYIGEEVEMLDNARQGLLVLIGGDEYKLTDANGNFTGYNPKFVTWKNWEIRGNYGVNAATSDDLAGIVITPNGGPYTLTAFENFKIMPNSMNNTRVTLRAAKDSTVSIRDAYKPAGNIDWGLFERCTNLTFKDVVTKDNSLPYFDTVTYNWESLLPVIGEPTITYVDRTAVTNLTRLNSTLIEKGVNKLVYRQTYKLNAAAGNSSIFRVNVPNILYKVGTVTGYTEGWTQDGKSGAIGSITTGEFVAGWGSGIAQEYRMYIYITLTF